LEVEAPGRLDTEAKDSATADRHLPHFTYSESPPGEILNLID